jgi:hypothetical protein
MIVGAGRYLTGLLRRARGLLTDVLQSTKSEVVHDVEEKL